MISRIHEKLGTAGFIVSIVALVAALGGGAYAAGLTSQEKSLIKSESKKFSKQFSKQFAKPGATGATGAPGAAGKDGTSGANGSDGSDGTNGKNVEVNEVLAGPDCSEGGASVQVAGEASTKEVICNGEEGSPWTAGGTLPPGETLTGVYRGAGTTGSIVQAPIEFAIPIEGGLALANATYVTGASATGCPGVVAGVPTADPGYLCAYKGASAGNAEVPPGVFFLSPQSSSFGEAVTPAGTLLSFVCTSPNCTWFGTWAATAPTA